MDKQMKKKIKAVQKAFNDDDFILKIIHDMGGIDTKGDFREDFAKIFAYYFASGDKNHDYTIEQMDEKMWDLESKGVPLVDQRYYFQAYNGCYDASYQKNGLDDISSLDTRVKEAMETLEREIGKTDKVTAGGDDKISRSFVTTDFKMLMRYALDFSPERLWYGPLNDSVNGDMNSLKSEKRTMIRVGEKKSDYIMRIIESKLEGKTEEEKERLRSAGRIIAEEFGTKKPRIAIIPESEIKDFKADFDSDTPNIDKQKPDSTIQELAEQGNAFWTLSFENGLDFSYEGGVALYDKVTPGKFVTVSIPDSYDLMQLYAIERGAQFGDLINPNNGRLVERAKEQAMTVSKKQNVFSKFVDRIKNGKENNAPKQNEIHEEGQKYYENMRTD